MSTSRVGGWSLPVNREGARWSSTPSRAVSTCGCTASAVTTRPASGTGARKGGARLSVGAPPDETSPCRLLLVAVQLLGTIQDGALENGHDPLTRQARDLYNRSLLSPQPVLSSRSKLVYSPYL